MTLLLGIDPGTRHTGWGVILVEPMRPPRLVAHGVWTFAAGPGKLAETRASCDRLNDELVALHRGRGYFGAVAWEAFVFFKGRQTTEAAEVGRLIGTIESFARRYQLPHAEYPTQTVKSVVCGTRKASKDQVADRVRFLLGLTERPRPSHAADALAVALCHSAKAPVLAAIARNA